MVSYSMVIVPVAEANPYFRDFKLEGEIAPPDGTIPPENLNCLPREQHRLFITRCIPQLQRSCRKFERHFVQFQ